MAATVTHSMVQQFASMKPNEFGPTIEPKWQVGERLLKEVKLSVEKGYLTPLDGARLISSISATLFGYDEFILREISPETWLASTPSRPAVDGESATVPDWQHSRNSAGAGLHQVADRSVAPSVSYFPSNRHRHQSARGSFNSRHWVVHGPDIRFSACAARQRSRSVVGDER